MTLFRSAEIQGLNPVKHVLQLTQTTLATIPTRAGDRKISKNCLTVSIAKSHTIGVIEAGKFQQRKAYWKGLT
ncbi:MAG: hypothetical protein ACREYF_19600 [Gammaproteobacteria bacterium]